MSWIGLWDRNGATFDPNGIGNTVRSIRAGQNRPTPDTFLPRGTILLEFRHDPTDRRRNLLRFSAREPWHSSLTIFLEPSGIIQVLAGQGTQSTAFAMQTEMPGTEKAVILQYSWDALDRTAVLSLRTPEKDTLFLAEFRNPLPLCLRDVERIICDDTVTERRPEVVYVAIADTVEPTGPIATIDETAWVETISGRRNITDIGLGQLLIAPNGDLAQVRWVGSQILPARGRYAPCILHAPFYAARRQILLAPEQKLRLVGSEIEYHFGKEEVSASVRHLVDGHSIVIPPAPLTQRYYQILLDQPGVLNVCGAPIESLDPQAFLNDPGLLRHSLLRDLPPELLPDFEKPKSVPILRCYEALALAR